MKLNNLKNRSRQSALKLLEKQLSSGVKPLKIDGKTTKERVSLSESDIKRINKEMDILKSKIILS